MATLYQLYAAALATPGPIRTPAQQAAIAAWNSAVARVAGPNSLQVSQQKYLSSQAEFEAWKAGARLYVVTGQVDGAGNPVIVANDFSQFRNAPDSRIVAAYNQMMAAPDYITANKISDGLRAMFPTVTGNWIAVNGTTIATLAAAAAFAWGLSGISTSAAAAQAPTATMPTATGSSATLSSAATTVNPATAGASINAAGGAVTGATDFSLASATVTPTATTGSTFGLSSGASSFGLAPATSSIGLTGGTGVAAGSGLTATGFGSAGLVTSAGTVAGTSGLYSLSASSISQLPQPAFNAIMADAGNAAVLSQGLNPTSIAQLGDKAKAVLAAAGISPATLAGGKGSTPNQQTPTPSGSGSIFPILALAGVAVFLITKGA